MAHVHLTSDALFMISLSLFLFVSEFSHELSKSEPEQHNQQASCKAAPLFVLSFTLLSVDSAKGHEHQ